MITGKKVFFSALLMALRCCSFIHVIKEYLFQNLMIIDIELQGP